MTTDITIHDDSADAVLFAKHGLWAIEGVIDLARQHDLPQDLVNTFRAINAVVVAELEHHGWGSGIVIDARDSDPAAETG